jgi:hypothetical protein
MNANLGVGIMAASLDDLSSIRAEGPAEWPLSSLCSPRSVKLACDGHDAITLAAYAGHRQLQDLKRYVQLSPERFKGFRWKD